MLVLRQFHLVDICEDTWQIPDVLLFSKCFKEWETGHLKHLVLELAQSMSMMSFFSFTHILYRCSSPGFPVGLVLDVLNALYIEPTRAAESFTQS